MLFSANSPSLVILRVFMKRLGAFWLGFFNFSELLAIIFFTLLIWLFLMLFWYSWYFTEYVIISLCSKLSSLIHLSLKNILSLYFSISFSSVLSLDILNVLILPEIFQPIVKYKASSFKYVFNFLIDWVVTNFLLFLSLNFLLAFEARPALVQTTNSAHSKSLIVFSSKGCRVVR